MNTVIIAHRNKITRAVTQLASVSEMIDTLTKKHQKEKDKNQKYTIANAIQKLQAKADALEVKLERLRVELELYTAD